MKFRDLACRVSAAFASPIAVIGFPVACTMWLSIGLGVDRLTLALSILAITTTQLVLVGQERAAAKQDAKINELIHAVPDADDDLLRRLDEADAKR